MYTTCVNKWSHFRKNYIPVGFTKNLIPTRVLVQALPTFHSELMSEMAKSSRRGILKFAFILEISFNAFGDENLLHWNRVLQRLIES